MITSLAMAGHAAERVVRVGPRRLVPSARGALSGPVVELFLSRLEAAGGHPVDLSVHERDVRRLLVATGGLPLLVEQSAVQAALLGLANAAPAGSLAEAVGASYDLLRPDQQRCFRRLAHVPCPVGIEAMAAVVGVGAAEARRLAMALVGRSLVEVLRDGRFDMLSPIRAHARTLPGGDDYVASVRRGLLAWADRVAPDHENYGAADEPWLVDLPAHAARRRWPPARTPPPATWATRLANRVFSSLYTSMRARDAVEILEAVADQRRRSARDRSPGRPTSRDRGVRGTRHLRGALAAGAR